MGVCNSIPEEQKAAMVRNKSVASSIQKNKSAAKRVIKLLLLGAGESGKSTVLKQMKIMHCGGFNANEKRASALLIRNNVLGALKLIIREAEEQKLILPDQSSLIEAINSRSVTEEQYPEIPTFCAHETIQKLASMGSGITLPDSLSYFLRRVDTIFASDFVPSDQDVLRARQATSGIIETKFNIQGSQFALFDVGGQRGERKKWIHCFDEVCAVLFIASLAEFDQTLVEERSVGRMEESLQLFLTMLQMRWFTSVPFILFLNKKDLFQEKLDAGIRLTQYVPEFSGPDDFDTCYDFIKSRFLAMKAQAETHAQKVFVHCTNATDTDNIERVWTNTKKIVITKHLQDAGFAQPTI